MAIMIIKLSNRLMKVRIYYINKNFTSVINVMKIYLCLVNFYLTKNISVKHF